MDTSDEPTTIALVALTAASAGTAAYGQYQSGRAAKAQGESEQDWQEYNAKVAEQEATASRMAGMEAAADKQAQRRRHMKSMEAGYAKSGVTGASPLLAKIDTAYEFQKDIARTLRHGMVGAQKQSGQATMFRGQGAMAAQRGSSAKTASMWGAGSSLLSGAATGAYRYQTLKDK